MKTAMQELISTFHLYQNSASTYEEQELLSFYIKCVEDLLKKEKEQIIEAHAFGADDVDSNGGLLLRGVKNAIYYYNQTYNQNK
jgi:hypothetical protein